MRPCPWLCRCLLIFLCGLLTACGGGGGGDDHASDSPDPPPPLMDDPQPGESLAVGLDRRPQNLSCIAPPRPARTAALALQRVFPNLRFERPLAMLQAPGDNRRWYVVEQIGRVMVFDNHPSVGAARVFVDLRQRVDASFHESGLLGMAFHPDFAVNGQVFLSYTVSAQPLHSRVTRFISWDGGESLDVASEQPVVDLPQPTDVHQGGGLRFGPDGYLYIAFGDGGNRGLAQQLDNWYGGMLRIDVDNGLPYSVPLDNPLLPGVAPELWAWGFRNPWSWSFDRATGELWVGDVGESDWEEVNRVEKGGNYGWPVREGNQCFRGNCDRADLIDPVWQYGHDQGCSITGGYVYRGSAIPGLQGSYLFADLCNGKIWGLDSAADGSAAARLLNQSGRGLAAFAEDVDGELYVVDIGTGDLHQLVAAPGDTPVDDFPRRLSQTGCVDPNNPSQPAAGLIAYDVNAPFWSDGALKARWFALPEGSTVTVEPDGDWQLPIGSVVMKNFQLAGQLIETRLLVRHGDGDWAGYSYAWEGNDAVYVAGGAVREVAGGFQWIYPSSAQCLECHTVVAGRTLGLETVQLNGDFVYPSSDRLGQQLATLDAIGVFHHPLTDPRQLPVLADPSDPMASLEDRARAYLHTNCAQCHRAGSDVYRLGVAAFDVHYATPEHALGLCDATPLRGDLGILGARIIAPANPGLSLLHERIQRRDSAGMPPVGSLVVDWDGVELLREWIAAGGGCGG